MSSVIMLGVIMMSATNRYKMLSVPGGF